jgi:glycosyltransferase involved in cell wall biosynthesis
VHRRWQIERGNQAALARALEVTQPDVVSAWSMGAMSLGLLTTVIERGLPLVCMVCDDWMLYGPKVDAWMRLFTGRPALAAAARATGVPTRLPELGEHATHCFVSRSTRHRAESRSGWTLRRAAVVYGGVDTTGFRAAATDAPSWRWRLLYAGRIDERKGIETVIRSLAHLPSEATVRVQGRGDDAELARLHRIAGEAGVAERVSFGVCERDELPAVYAAADVVVFPSTWEEPFGMVPIEAMASRRPVVATTVGGSAEFLADGANCLRFEPGDSASLAAAVTRLAEDDALRAALVRGGDATADELSLDRYIDVVEAWHVGAATGFRDGVPPDRALPVSPVEG